MIPLPPISFGQSSGVNGDTKSGPLGDLYFAAPFAVGSGASASASQSGGGFKLSPAVIISGIVATVLFLVALARR
jgi:hypothetical protein